MMEEQKLIDRMGSHLEDLRVKMATVGQMGLIQGEQQSKNQRLSTLESLAGSAIQTLVIACDAIAEMGAAIDSMREQIDNLASDIHGDPEPPVVDPEPGIFDQLNEQYKKEK
jgi:uncharacterized coiled-coil protein SlyX